MLKQIYLLRRHEDLTREEFQSHWKNHHAQFGKQFQDVRRYVQYHAIENDPITETLPQASEGELEPFDGAAVAWFDDVESFKTGITTSNVVEEAFKDEQLFIDHDRSVVCLTEEDVVVEPIGSGNVVLIECLTRKEDLTREEFQDHWVDHQEIGKKAHAGGEGLLSGYIQNHTIAESEEVIDEIGGDVLNSEGTFDGVVTAYFDSVVTAKRLFGSPVAAQESYEDEKKFIDHSRGAYMLTRPNVVKDRIR